jgi:hypothetical protein
MEAQYMNLPDCPIDKNSYLVTPIHVCSEYASPNVGKVCTCLNACHSSPKKKHCSLLIATQFPSRFSSNDIMLTQYAVDTVFPSAGHIVLGLV